MRPIALCLGGARPVWDELDAALLLIGDRDHLIVACNFAGIVYEGRLDAWVTLHPEMFDDWREERGRRGGNQDYRAFTCRRMAGLPVEVLASRWFGSSGCYTAQVAIDALDCAGAILCGVPMDDTGRHIHWSGEWDHGYHYREGLQAIARQTPPVRSMSGYTKEVFGAPDAAWIEGLQ